MLPCTEIQEDLLEEEPLQRVMDDRRVTVDHSTGETAAEEVLTKNEEITVMGEDLQTENVNHATTVRVITVMKVEKDQMVRTTMEEKEDILRKKLTSVVKMTIVNMQMLRKYLNVYPKSRIKLFLTVVQPKVYGVFQDTNYTWNI